MQLVRKAPHAIIAVHLSVHTLTLHRFCHLASLAFTLSPRSQVAFADNRGVSFSCDAEEVLSVTWIINGTYYDNLSSSVLADIQFNRRTENGMIFRAALIVPAILAYNETRVQCSILGTDYGILTSLNASLILQGIDIVM